MKKVLIVGLVVALGIGLGGLASAHYAGRGGYGGHMMGYGYGGHMMGSGYGQGYGPGYGGCRDESQASQLTPEQTQKLDQLRQKQWKETKGIRDELYSKSQELQSLYTQPNPDQKAIDKLQKETFDLEQRLREKNFAFQQEANKIVPEFRGHYGYGQGGYHMGPGWGGGCW